MLTLMYIALLKKKKPLRFRFFRGCDKMTEIEVYSRLISRFDTYAYQTKDLQYYRNPGTLTNFELQRSLRTNSLTVGTYCINPENQTCRNPVIDIDGHTDEEKEQVIEKTQAVYNALEDAGLKPYIEASSGKITEGAHVGLICQPTPASQIRAFLSNVLADIPGIEIFPKQDRIETGSYGNLVKLPWQYNNRSGCRSEIVDPDSLENMSREQAIQYMLQLPDSRIPKVKVLEKRDIPVLAKCSKCFQEAYNQGVVLEGEPGHNFRLYACRELIFHGATDAEIHEFFKVQRDYDQSVTQRKIDDLRRNSKKPITCEKIKSTGYVSADMCQDCLRKKKNSDIPEVPPEIIEAADNIMKNYDPVSYILDVHQTIHVGDRNTAETCLLSIGAQSVKNANGIQPKVTGASGKGKTHCVRAMAHLMPPEWVLETTLSDKALFYMDIQPGTVIFSDDANLSEGMTGLIKRSTSNFQKGGIYTTVDRQLKPVTMTIPPRLVFWLTSVDDDDEMQLLNRQFGGSVDESPEQDLKVVNFHLARAAEGIEDMPVTDDVLICREIIRKIKSECFSVVIPFADRIEWRDTANRRNFSIFLDMVYAYAVLRHKVREVDDKGRLIAQEQDFEDAKELYSSRADLQGLKLTAQEKKVIEIINQTGMIEGTELQKIVGVSKVRLSQLINGKNSKPESGLAYKIPELHIEKVTKREDDTTVTRNYYSLHNFCSLKIYENKIVELKTAAISEVNPWFTCSLPCSLPNIYNIYINNNRHNIEVNTGVVNQKQNYKDVNFLEKKNF